LKENINEQEEEDINDYEQQEEDINEQEGNYDYEQEDEDNNYKKKFYLKMVCGNCFKIVLRANYQSHRSNNGECVEIEKPTFRFYLLRI